MPYVAVPDHLAGDVFTLANWQTHIEGNLNAGVNRPLYDSGILGVAAASINITSIPATFAHLMIVAYLRGDTAASTIGLFMRFNNDTAANYDYQRGNFSAGVAGAAEQFAQASMLITNSIPANTAGANLLGGVVILVPNYANATGNKASWSAAVTKTGAATTNMVTEMNGNYWRSNAAINQVTLFLGAGNVQIGSRVTLYGMAYI